MRFILLVLALVPISSSPFDQASKRIRTKALTVSKLLICEGKPAGYSFEGGREFRASNALALG